MNYDSPYSSNIIADAMAEFDRQQPKTQNITGLNKPSTNLFTNYSPQPNPSLLDSFSVEDVNAPIRQASHFIASFEQFSPRAFNDYKQYTNGYGTRAKSKDEVISQEEATSRLNARTKKDYDFVNGLDKTMKYNWTQNQKIALTSFAFNLGRGNLLKLIDNGKRDNEQIASSIRLYTKAGGKVLKGLVNRRDQEAKLFEQGIQEK